VILLAGGRSSASGRISPSHSAMGGFQAAQKQLRDKDYEQLQWDVHSTKWVSLELAAEGLRRGAAANGRAGNARGDLGRCPQPQFAM